ncbi:spore germination protein [Brevibacillus choshinensis]|uniref:spore germination protein n=1 Tax=Brevibacillus choshinensis TaxID=54911 RepID=UPI002E1B1039|nr:spore germination protein [Brevibacillus choshinensis]MED4755365.1 spore germination protein [Brevibacillus choshinensis]
MNLFWKAWKMRKERIRSDFLHAHSNRSIENVPDIDLSSNLKENIALIEQLIKCDDLVARRFVVKTGVDAIIFFIDGMIDRNVISDYIIRHMTSSNRTYDRPATNELESTTRLRQVIRNILSGTAVLLLDGHAEAYLNNARGWERRKVKEPLTESVVRGPRDGFCETLCVNSALIRFRLKDPKLRLRHLVVGQRTQTDIYVLYVDGIVDPRIVEDVLKRIDSINVDGVLESGFIEHMIEDSTWSPFPQMQNTERPDKVVANLLEGKVAILVDGTPFALIVPTIFAQFYQSPEDYYERHYIATLVRLIRFISFALALLLPSLYISFTSFHPEMIPSRLVIAMAAGRSTVPFPSLVEAFIMEIAIEILREASARLPRPIGPTIGIVGALVIGESAVKAGLVSPVMVIIVALTTIASFTSPSYSAAISTRVLRFPLMIMAGVFGLYGIMLCLLLILVHLASLKSFGVTYLTPLSPLNLRGMKDFVIRIPLVLMKRRPTMFHPQDEIRINGEDKQ